MEPLTYIKPYVTQLIELTKIHYGKRLVSLAVFGSLAKGVFKRNRSDIDLLLILSDSSKNHCKRVDEFVKNVLMPYYSSSEYIKALRTTYLPPVSVVIYSREEARFFHDIYLDMTLWCEILHDKDSFLKKVLDAMRKKIDEWGSVRKEVSGKSFWVLKPDLKMGEELIDKTKPLV